MVVLLQTAERWGRARIAASAGVELARRYGDTEAQRDLLRARGHLERRLGLEAEAAASEEALRALGDAEKE